ncbi:MAG: oxygen-dependent coproporphyrinogen oxidase [Bacteroidetes bacterium]|nr:oxygen-dependent coproporphyrinogen oxidase [Bacteroidota bacterium]
MITKDSVSSAFRELQSAICTDLKKEDGGAEFSSENWERDGGGGGITKVIQYGAIIEKGGVNFSAVHGELPEKIMHALKVNDKNFFATGVSIVIHPSSPMVPIIHMNVRYFELADGTWWFGGGIDLTPIYVVEDDAVFFHRQLKKVCDKFDAKFYPCFRKNADEYFFIKHRNETRGIGGIFFDRLADRSKEDLFEFVMAVGNIFSQTYVEIIRRNRTKKYGEKEKKWQLIRRGRYVEFNLVYDKGTKFGLMTDGRTESILMSLPENASWIYNFVPGDGSEEEKTLALLKKGIDWANKPA